MVCGAAEMGWVLLEINGLRLGGGFDSASTMINPLRCWNKPTCSRVGRRLFVGYWPEMSRELASADFVRGRFKIQQRFLSGNHDDEEFALHKISILWR